MAEEEEEEGEETGGEEGYPLVATGGDGLDVGTTG